MDNRKQQPFYVGQRVVALVSVGSLRKNNIYTVLGLFMCPHCKVWYVQHSTTTGKNDNDMYPCCRRPVATSGYRSAMANKFAPYDPPAIEIPAELLKEPVEERSDAPAVLTPDLLTPQPNP